MRVLRRVGLSKVVSVVLPFLALSLPVFGFDYAAELNERYAPYVDWESQIALESLEKASRPEAWWQSPEDIRNLRSVSDGPLSGLHLALDPGHLGGEWAEIEGRNFKIDPADFPVREGELVLEVARRVQAELVDMGAEVTLLRDSSAPRNPNPPEAYFLEASKRVTFPKEVTWASFVDYTMTLQRAMARLSVVTGELVERARLVNEEIRPDALISLHMNAASWPVAEGGETKRELVDSNHTHVLIFGRLSDSELSLPRQLEQLMIKLTNGSAGIERKLGQALGVSLGEATALPPSNYSARNAVLLQGYTPYLWARNLMLLRSVQCPVILLEPYIVNSKETYPRIQIALNNRQLGKPLADDDILLEYAGAVVAGILEVYGPKEN